MSDCTDKALRGQMESLRRHFGQEEGLAFREVLSTERLERALEAENEQLKKLLGEKALEIDVLKKLSRL